MLGPLAEAKRLAPVPQQHRPESRSAQPLVAELSALAGPGSRLGQRGLWRAAGLAGFLLLLSRRTCWRSLAAVRRKRGRNIIGLAKDCSRAEGAKSGVKYGTVEPLAAAGQGWCCGPRGGLRQRARQLYDALRYKTFEPTIAGPPFVRALTELVEAAKLGPAEQLEFDPAAVRAEFWKGTTAMAISWPTAAGASGHTPPARPPVRRAEHACCVCRTARRDGGLPRLKRQVGTAKRRRRPARAAAGRRRTDRRGPRGQPSTSTRRSSSCSG